MAFFCRQLAEAPWPAVLAEWVQRLIPGVMAAGTHGLIRTAHAVRALDDAETPLRLEELAAAIGVLGRLLSGTTGRPPPRRLLPHRPGTRPRPPPRA